LLSAVLAQPRVKRLLSSEHFSVDGTLIEAWASMKSFKPKDGSGEPPANGGRNAAADFHGQKRSNETHASTTDPDARLYRKGPGKEAKLCFIGHGLMENRSGLLVDACLSEADGHAERVAARHMIEPRADRPRPITLGGDKNFDTADFVNELRSIAGRRGTTAMRSVSGCESASRRRSAGSRPSPDRGRRSSGALIVSDGPSPSRLRPTISFACRSCWRRPADGHGPHLGRGRDRPTADRRTARSVPPTD
jgi:hypothetical protein